MLKSFSFYFAVHGRIAKDLQPIERTFQDFVYDDHGLVLLYEDPPYVFKEADACTRYFYPGDASFLVYF